jgi:hypothetical protein
MDSLHKPSSIIETQSDNQAASEHHLSNFLPPENQLECILEQDAINHLQCHHNVNLSWWTGTNITTGHML